MGATLLPLYKNGKELRYSFDMDKEAEAIETAVQQVLTEGYRTGDIYSEGCKKVGTIQMGDLIADRIHA